MYKTARSILALAVIVLCFSIPISGYAAIGAEPSTQMPDSSYSSADPGTSVPPYPGVIPGMTGEGAAYSQQPYMSSPSGGMEMPYSPPYGTLPGYQGDMSGMLYSPYNQMPQSVQMSPNVMYPYPPYSQGTPPTYQDPYSIPGQNSGYPSTIGPWYPYPSQQPHYGSVDQLYNQAMQAYRSRDYWSAMAKFGEVATLYPQSDLADNAYYWMGEIHYAGKNFPAAIQSFQTVLNSYPQGNKVPDAMVKMGYAYAEMRQYHFARSVLNDVAARFRNNSRIRNLAVKKLNELNNLY